MSKFWPHEFWGPTYGNRYPSKIQHSFYTGADQPKGEELSVASSYGFARARIAATIVLIVVCRHVPRLLEDGSLSGQERFEWEMQIFDKGSLEDFITCG